MSDQEMMSRFRLTPLQPSSKVVVAVLMATLLLLSVWGTIALADGNEDPAGLPSEVDSLQASQSIEGGESGPIEAGTVSVPQEVRNSAPPLTDPEVAEQLPHADLGRSEASELMEGVFSPLLEMPAGIWSIMNTRFRAAYFWIG